MLRGQKVLLDTDLAALYGLETGRFNEQIRRNAERFPVDFMFQLSSEEYAALISQFAISKPGCRGERLRGTRLHTLAAIPHVRICAGGVRATGIPTATP